MDKNLFVDIVITTRNNGQILRQALNSVKKQTFLNYKCYVIDDCSTDDTAKIVQSEFPWVKFLGSEEWHGPSYSRNIAIAKGNAPFIVTLDDDVVIPPDWLKEMVDFISFSRAIGAVSSQLRSGYSHSTLMGTGGFFAGNGMGSDICFNVPLERVQNLVSRPMRVVFACTAAMIMRRSAFEKTGGFDSKYLYFSEDYDLGLRMNSCGYLVLYNPKAIAYHYYHKAARQNFSSAKLDHLYYRYGLCTVLKNFSAVTVLCMMPYFFFGIPKKFHLMVKAAIWNLFYVNHIIKSRHYIRKHRTVKENQILTLNLFLRSFYKYNVLAQAKQTKLLLWKKNLEKIPFMLSPLISRGFEEIFPKNRYVGNISFFITNLCNARCKHCFLRNTLNINEEKKLSLQEIEKFFSSLGKISNIVLGGGEPFLRQDIDQMCVILEKTSSPRAFTIPTNGLAHDIVFEKVKSILEKTKTRLIISLSVDGPAKIHDEIRGVPGLFDKVEQTYTKLLPLYYMFYPRLTLQINTTVFDRNYEYFSETHKIVRQKFPHANFAFEVMRGSFDISAAKPITIEMYENLIKTALELRDPLLERSLWLHNVALKTLRQKKQIIPCNAGRDFIVLDHMGNLAPCEVLSQIVNIREIGYNFLDIKNSANWKKSVQNIRDGKCYCTHMCFLGSSANDNWNKLRTYIKKHENRN